MTLQIIQQQIKLIFHIPVYGRSKETSVSIMYSQHNIWDIQIKVNVVIKQWSIGCVG